MSVSWEIKFEHVNQEKFSEKVIEWGIEGWQPCLVLNNHLILKRRRDD